MSSCLQVRQQTQLKQEQSELKHQADMAEVRADQHEMELRRLRSVVTESSDLQDSARRVWCFCLTFSVVIRSMS